jgi:DNA transposition AAA+ family ATPase
LFDEADRLKTAGLEQLRDLSDRSQIGLVLIGMPGLQKRLARYPQLYSRVGFVHQFMPLGGAELRDVIRRQSLQLGLGLELHDGNDAGVLSSIVRITGGNFRLVERLFAQIERVAEINDVTTLTTDLVVAAQESLVIGAL